MEKKKKFEPEDSARHRREDEQTITPPAEPVVDRKAAKTDEPALKRKYSEQPPTKHNAKT